MTKVIVTSPVWSLNGVNTFAANLVRGLRDTDIDARLVLTGVTYRERKPFPLPRDIPVEQLKLPVFATWSRRLRALADFLESEAPCIYLPNHDFQHSCISSMLSSRVGIVGIVHSDDAQHYDHASRLGQTWNATIAVSERIADRLRRSASVDPSRVRVIPYGIAAAKSLPMRPGDGALRILYTGRLESTQKRVADLIDVASGLDKRGTLFRMTIVGDGPERASLAREISARDLSRSVTLLEPVSNERILEMCRDHDAFILPSAYEGMPLGLLEAMGQGCIPVATDIESGVPELIRRGENGFIVGVGNIDEFVARLDDIAKSSSLRATMSENAWRTVAESRFASRAMIESYMSIFESVSREIAERAFRRSGRMRPVSLSLRDRIAAPLWYLRPSMRAQQKIAQ